MVALNPHTPADEAPDAQSIKLLDLLTNRYHAGILRGTCDAGLLVELPASSRFQPGQRVHFAFNDQPLIPRTTMRRRGYISRVSHPTPNAATRISLTPLPEAAVA